MLKVWKGPELEGFDKGIVTLFVASNTVIDETIIIQQLINYDIHRIYLGAGRTAFPGFNSIKTFINYCIDNNVTVLIEVDLLKPLLISETNIIEEHIVTPIYTIRANSTDVTLKKNSLFKYDDYSNVIVFKHNQSAHTNLDNLHGMVFEADTVLIDI